MAASADSAFAASACGSGNGQSLSVAPSPSMLCAPGNIFTNGKGSATGWTWNCTAQGANPANCSATLVSACGTGNLQSLTTAPSPSMLCAPGNTFTDGNNTSTGWTWKCTAQGASPASCSATRVIPTSACGTGNLQTLNSAPSPSMLCASGNIFSNGAGTSTGWTWNCTAIGATSAANCSATRTPSACGSGDGQILSSPPSPSMLCPPGNIYSNGQGTATGWTWNCNTPGASAVSCSAVRTPSACGTGNGQSLTTAPTPSMLCASGNTYSNGKGNSTGWTWNCTAPGATPAECAATQIPATSACGPAYGQKLSSAPAASLLCAPNNNYSRAGGSATGWYWYCTTPGASAVYCSATLLAAGTAGTCGSASGSTVSTAPTSNLCSAGLFSSVTGSGPWNWTCTGSAGTTPASCSANLQGTCGSAYGTTSSAAPTSNLCASGNPSSLSGSGPWTWTCNGSTGTTPAKCSAAKTIMAANGACGLPTSPYANGSTYSITNTVYSAATPTLAQCPYGGTKQIETVTTQTYSCNDGVQTAVGSPTVTSSDYNGLVCNPQTLVNGVCGSASGTTVSTTPAAGTLCSAGTASPSTLSGSGPWTWTCNGAGGGTAASCSANLMSAGTAGVCGSAGAASLTTAPSNNLCAVGSPSTVSAVGANGSGLWSWTCTGSTGTPASCTAQSLYKEMAERNGACTLFDPNDVDTVVWSTQFYDWLGWSTHSDFAMDYSWQDNWSDIVRSSSIIPACWHNAGYTKIAFGVAMIPSDGSTFATGVTGAYDTYYTQIAQNIVAAGYPNAVIRLGWEFNGYWNPWAAANDPANFVLLWQRIVNVMRAVPGAHFQFDWNYALGVGTIAPYNGEIAPSSVYPGDDYVDIIGADVYDTWWSTPFPSEAQRWQSWVTEFDGLQWQVDFAAAHNKQISFPEWGQQAYASGFVGDDPAFVDSMAQWIAAHNVAYHDLWNENYHGSELDVPNTLLPLSAAAFKRDFAQPPQPPQ